jgi:uncharacterized protein (TIGR03790 family)
MPALGEGTAGSVRLAGAGALIAVLMMLILAGTGRAASAPPIAIPRASITPKDLGVIVAQGDPVSQQIAAYYAQVRGIPAANIIQVPISTASDAISDTDFAAIKARVDGQLPSNVQATLLTWTAPSRVVGAGGAMSITSAMAFGYDPKWTETSPCTPTAPSPYYNSDSTTPWTDFHMRPSMMLGESTLAAAEALINRGVSADMTYPSGDGFLIRTSDVARSVRWTDFAPLPALWNHPNGLTLNYIDNSTGAGLDYIFSTPNVLFYFTGLVSVPQIATNTYLPGAIADHLTSFGGALPNGYGQMPATAWLDAGATGSFGTVQEPCNYTAKFPQASVVIDQYYRGASLIEAYWKSVQWPGEGLFLGEPLARPFEDHGSSKVEAGQYVISTRSFHGNSRYEIQYRSGPSSPWSIDSDLKMPYDQPVTWRAPVAPVGDQTRLAGPCSASPNLIATGGTGVQGGRPQTVDLQLTVDEGAGGCGPDNYNVSVGSLGDGLTASLDTTTLRSFSSGNPGPKQYGVLQISIPAAVGQSATTTTWERVPLDIANTRTGQVIHSVRTIFVYPSSATVAPLRFIRPNYGWVLTDQPARPYQIPVALDVAPSSGITSVQLLFAPNPATGSDTYQTTVTAPDFTGQILPPALAPGAYYTVTATGYDASGAQVAQTYVNLSSNFTLP